MCLGPTIRTHSKEELVLRNLFTYIPNFHIICTPFSKYHADAAVCLPCPMFFRLFKRILLITQVLVKAGSTNRYLVYIFTQSPVTHLQTCPSCVLCVPQSFQGIQGNVRFLIPVKRIVNFMLGEKKRLQRYATCTFAFSPVCNFTCMTFRREFSLICYHCGDLRRRF